MVQHSRLGGARRLRNRKLRGHVDGLAQHDQPCPLCPCPLGWQHPAPTHLGTLPGQTAPHQARPIRRPQSRRPAAARLSPPWSPPAAASRRGPLALAGCSLFQPATGVKRRERCGEHVFPWLSSGCCGSTAQYSHPGRMTDGTRRQSIACTAPQKLPIPSPTCRPRPLASGRDASGGCGEAWAGRASARVKRWVK